MGNLNLRFANNDIELKSRNFTSFSIFSFIFLASLSSSVDMLNGAVLFVLGYSLPISLTFKFLIVINAIILLFANKQMVVSVLLVLILFFSVVFVSEVNSDMSKIVLAYSNAFKLFFPFITLLVFIYLINNNFVTRTSLVNILLINFVFLFIGVFVGYMGIGNSTYSGQDGGTGTKGVFIAGNEVAACFIVFYSYFLFRKIASKSMSVIIFITFGFVFAITLATKAVFLGFLIITSFFYYWRLSSCVTHFNHFVGMIKSLFLLSIMLFSTYLCLSAIDFDFHSLGFMDRFLFHYEQGGLLRLFLSNRDIFVQELYSLSDFSSLKNIIFGHGISYFAFYTNKYSSEVDPFDIFIWYGSIVLLFISLLYIFQLLLTFKWFLQIKTPATFSAFISSMILFFMAFIMGHVWLSGMLAIGYSTLIALAYYDFNITRRKVV